MNQIENANQVKRLSRGWSDDMDDQAIARRLEIVDRLYETWLKLKTAKPIHQESENNSKDQ